MMKTVSKYWSMAYMAILMGAGTSCTSDEILNNNSQTQLIKMDTISISTGAANTRVAYDNNENPGKLTWQKGDQIKVIAVIGSNMVGKVYTLIGDGGSETGQFVGEAIEGTVRMYMVVYPKDFMDVTNGNIYSLFDNTSQEQDGDNTTGHLKEHLVISGMGADLNTLTVAAAYSTLKFHFTNLPTDLGELKSITWQSSLERLFRTKASGESDAVIITESSSQTLKLKNISVTGSDQEVTAYMALDNSSGSKGLKLTAGSTLQATVYGTNGKSYYAEVTLAQDVTYLPGKYYTADMSAWTLHPTDAFDNEGSYGDADGTQSKPYKIATKEQLTLLATRVNANEATYSSAYYKLTNNIDLENTAWNPITNFSGNFDGSAYTISGLNVSGNVENAGLFGQNSGMIYALHVEGNVSSTHTAANCGGIVGENAATLVVSSFAGTVSGTTNTGGLVGNNTSTGKTVSCYSTASSVTGGSNCYAIAGLASDNPISVIGCCWMEGDNVPSAASNSGTNSNCISFGSRGIHQDQVDEMNTAITTAGITIPYELEYKNVGLPLLKKKTN